jgi:hypothetical protein
VTSPLGTLAGRKQSLKIVLDAIDPSLSTSLIAMPASELFDIQLRVDQRSSGHGGQGCWVRQVDARDLDDGLPRGFLAGAIVEVWLALHLNWA